MICVGCRHANWVEITVFAANAPRFVPQRSPRVYPMLQTCMNVDGMRLAVGQTAAHALWNHLPAAEMLLYPVRQLRRTPGEANILSVAHDGMRSLVRLRVCSRIFDSQPQALRQFSGGDVFVAEHSSRKLRLSLSNKHQGSTTVIDMFCACEPHKCRLRQAYGWNYHRGVGQARSDTTSHSIDELDLSFIIAKKHFSF